MLLLFADDMAIVGDTVADLQNSLDSLYAYCQKWGLTVNTDKNENNGVQKMWTYKA